MQIELSLLFWGVDYVHSGHLHTFPSVWDARECNRPKSSSGGAAGSSMIFRAHKQHLAPVLQTSDGAQRRAIASGQPSSFAEALSAGLVGLWQPMTKRCAPNVFATSSSPGRLSPSVIYYFSTSPADNVRPSITAFSGPSNQASVISKVFAFY